VRTIFGSKGLRCTLFAHRHDDRFPIQVSTNLGGSLEFLRAAYSVDGPFYFSYRHFEPITNELQTPKLLVCPADERSAATNFSDFRNEHLSYFVSSDPEFGRPDSIVTGDRNITPLFGSLARIGNDLYLRWTEELHRFKGNVLFGDGHVEQSNHGLSLSNSTVRKITRLLVPTVPPAAQAAAPTRLAGSLGNPNYVDQTEPGHASLNSGLSKARSGVSRVAPAGSTVSPPHSGGYIVYPPTTEVVLETTVPAAAETKPGPAQQTLSAMITNTPVNGPAEAAIEDEKAVTNAHWHVVNAGKRLVSLGMQSTYRFPWLLVILLIIAVLELIRRRMQSRRNEVPRAASEEEAPAETTNCSD
jgi:prepilin-type processing-associated H-X9-DG protein